MLFAMSAAYAEVLQQVEPEFIGQYYFTSLSFDGGNSWENASGPYIFIHGNSVIVKSMEYRINKIVNTMKDGIKYDLLICPDNTIIIVCKEDNFYCIQLFISGVEKNRALCTKAE